MLVIGGGVSSLARFFYVLANPSTALSSSLTISDFISTSNDDAPTADGDCVSYTNFVGELEYDDDKVAPGTLSSPASSQSIARPTKGPSGNDPGDGGGGGGSVVIVVAAGKPIFRDLLDGREEVDDDVCFFFNIVVFFFFLKSLFFSSLSMRKHGNRAPFIHSVIG